MCKINKRRRIKRLEKLVNNSKDKRKEIMRLLEKEKMNESN